MLFQYGALPRDDGLGDEQIVCLGQPDIRRDTVPCKKPDLIPHHQLRGGHPDPRSLPAHQHRGRDHPCQAVRNALCPQFLGKAHRAADEQHTQNDDHRGDVPAEIGRQHHIGQKGYACQHKQNDRERVQKSPPQAIEHGVRSPARQAVLSVSGAALLRLFIAVALAGNMKIPQQRILVHVCIIQHTPVRHRVCFHCLTSAGFFYHTIESSCCAE